MQPLLWSAGSAVIPFFIEECVGPALARQVAALQADRVLIVSDRTVQELHGGAIDAALAGAGAVRWLTFEPGESHKTLATVERLAGAALEAGASRRSVVIGVGGGLVGNVAGLLAGLLFRGVRLVQVPTTFLAMHDSITSLKQAVNCNGGKNVLGMYHVPVAVIVALEFLKTQTPVQLRSGAVELVKNALIFGGSEASETAALLSRSDWMLQPTLAALIRRGIDAKQRLLRDDPHERGAAVAFEYGHTIGHAIELAMEGRLSHGQAVALGMAGAAEVSRALGLMDAAGFAEHQALLELVAPTAAMPMPALPREGVLRRVMLDNKRGYLAGEGLPMVLLRRPGELVRGDGDAPLVAVPMGVIERAVDAIGFSSEPAEGHRSSVERRARPAG